jgi:hypothetical protein
MNGKIFDQSQLCENLSGLGWSEPLRGRMSESTRQVDGVFESLFSEAFS